MVGLDGTAGGVGKSPEEPTHHAEAKARGPIGKASSKGNKAIHDPETKPADGASVDGRVANSSDEKIPGVHRRGGHRLK